MAETLSMLGKIEKTSDARSSWDFVLELSKDAKADTGAMTFDIAPAATVTLDPFIFGLGDVLVLKTPKQILLGLTFDAALLPAPTVTDMPVEETLLLHTKSLKGFALTNPQTATVTVTVSVVKL